MISRKHIAELIGTFTLTSAVGLSILLDLPLSTPLVAGLTLGLFVYTIGDTSGAHLNPAVTIGLATVKKIDVKEAVFYILAQVLGALLAMSFLKTATSDLPSLNVENTLSVGLVEAMGAFLLVLGVTAVVYKQVEKAASGAVIGGSLLLGILMTAGLSNGVLNPAVAIGIQSLSLAYVVGPIAGGIVAALIAERLFKKGLLG